MKLSSPQDAIHRGQLYRLLIAIADDSFLNQNLIFKGGTCATMLGRLDRFSVDLDFDLFPQANQEKITQKLESIFPKLGFTIKNKSQKVTQYHLKYQPPISGHNIRNTLQLDAVHPASPQDTYSPKLLPDIDRYFVCQDIDTMFAYKLLALKNRYDKHGSVAGRDLYDLRYFFLSNYKYNQKIIEKQANTTTHQYLKKLIQFIKEKVTQTTINEDLNTLLPYNQFNALRKSIKPELISLLKDELARTT